MTRGRIAKPEKRFARRALYAPKSLWARLDAAIPAGQRSDFIRDAITDSLDLYERVSAEGDRQEAEYQKRIAALRTTTPDASASPRAAAE